MNENYEKRSDVPKEYTWAVEDLYASDEDWKKDLENIKGRVLNTYVISKFYRILYLSQSRLIFLSNFEIYLLYGDVRY